MKTTRKINYPLEALNAARLIVEGMQGEKFKDAEALVRIQHRMKSDPLFATFTQMSFDKRAHEAHLEVAGSLLEDTDNCWDLQGLEDLAKGIETPDAHVPKCARCRLDWAIFRAQQRASLMGSILRITFKQIVAATQQSIKKVGADVAGAIKVQMEVTALMMDKLGKFIQATPHLSVAPSGLGPGDHAPTKFEFQVPDQNYSIDFTHDRVTVFVPNSRMDSLAKGSRLLMFHGSGPAIFPVESPEDPKRQGREFTFPGLSFSQKDVESLDFGFESHFYKLGHRYLGELASESSQQERVQAATLLLRVGSAIALDQLLEAMPFAKADDAIAEAMVAVDAAVVENLKCSGKGRELIAAVGARTE